MSAWETQWRVMLLPEYWKTNANIFPNVTNDQALSANLQVASFNA
jgi:hypothetical protein